LLYRVFRKISTGQWLNVLMTADGDEFSITAAAHVQNMADALSINISDIEAIDGSSDPRDSSPQLVIPVQVD
jgi:hypothetical protein